MFVDDVLVRLEGPDGEVELTIDGEVEPGEPGNYSGHPDSRRPAEPDRADFCSDYYTLVSYPGNRPPGPQAIWKLLEANRDRVNAAILEAYRTRAREPRDA